MNRIKRIISIVVILCFLTGLVFLFSTKFGKALLIIPGISYDLVTKLLGTPDHWVTSSFGIAHYNINNQFILVVHYEFSYSREQYEVEYREVIRS